MQGLVGDEVANAVRRFVIADDVFVIIVALPRGRAGGAPPFVDAFGGSMFPIHENPPQRPRIGRDFRAQYGFHSAASMLRRRAGAIFHRAASYGTVALPLPLARVLLFVFLPVAIASPATTWNNSRAGSGSAGRGTPVTPA